MDEIDILERQAIDSAINFNWKEAIEINKKILSIQKDNPSAYLRLGFAYLQSNDLDRAKKFYKKTLKIQPANNVAKENLEKIKILQSKKSFKNKTISFRLDPNLFLEIPGKTKTFILVNLGQKNVLAHLNVGQEVFLRTKKRKVEIRTKEKDYIGTLPDDVSRRLIFFLKAKCQYSCLIKETSLSRVIVFVKEEKKSKKTAKFLSFPQNIKKHLPHINVDDDTDSENDIIYENDIEKLAETITNEEKDYSLYKPDDEEKEDEE